MAKARAAEVVALTACLAARWGLAACASNPGPGACDGGEAGAVGDAALEGAAAEAGPDATDAQPGASESSAPDAGDATVGDAGDDSAAAPPVTLALLRIANWSPDAPAIDFCTAAHGTTKFTGPLVGADAGVAGGGSGIPFPWSTSYFVLAPGAYDLRFVVAGAGSCAAGVVPDVTSLPALVAGTGATVALMGEEVPTGGEPGLRVMVFSDEILGRGAAAPLKIRFINASPASGTVTFGEGSLGVMTFVSVASNVAFGETLAAQDPASDAGDAMAPLDDGYRYAPNLWSTPLSLHASTSMTDGVVTMPVTTTDGIPVTIVGVGGTSSGVPLGLVECVDSAGLAACRPLP